MIKLLEKKCKFLITGATGFIGTRLCQELLRDGHEITALTRQKNINSKNFLGKDFKDFSGGRIKFINDLDAEDFDYDIVINLAGEVIAQYWSHKNRAEIYHSRVNITQKIIDKIRQAKNPPKLFISGSAIGYYGTSHHIIFSENSQATKQNLFSQKICHDWENMALRAQEQSRVVLLRMGVVIGEKGGILKRLTPLFKAGFGGNIGDGAQIMSWIHLDDVMGILALIINNASIAGAINLVAPKSCSNADFSKALAKKYARPCLFHMPKIFAKIIFGKMGDELLLSSQKVAPHKAIENGYDFKYVDIIDALNP